MLSPLIKPVNAILAGSAYLQSIVTRKAVIRGMPVTVGAELTNFCNLSCPECNAGSGLMKRARGFMTDTLFDKIVSELKPYLYAMSLYFQGEPMLHPQFFPFLRKCSGIYTIVSTNGHFLTEESAEEMVLARPGKLIISLDGTDQEVYSTYRVNGRIDKVLDGIKNVSEAMKRHSSSMKFEIQFLVNRNNEHQIESIRKLADDSGASLKLKSMQLINPQSHEAWLPLKEKFRRYKYVEGSYIVKSRFPDRCARLWFNPVVTWDGRVIPCCFDKDADHVMGDLNVDSFAEIWDGPKYRIFRKSILSGRYMIDICRNCTSGLKGVRV